MTNYKVDLCVFKEMVDNLLAYPQGDSVPVSFSAYTAVRETDNEVVLILVGRKATGLNEVNLKCADVLYFNASGLSAEELSYVRTSSEALAAALTPKVCANKIAIEIRYYGCKGCGAAPCGCSSC